MESEHNENVLTCSKFAMHVDECLPQARQRVDFKVMLDEDFYSDEDEMSDEEEQDVHMQKQGIDMKEKAKGSDEDSDEEGGVSYSEHRKELITTDLTSHNAMALIQGYSDEDEMSDEEEQDVPMQKRGINIKEKANASDADECLPQARQGGYFKLVNGKVYPEIDDDGNEIITADREYATQQEYGGPVAEAVFQKLRAMGFVEHHISKLGGSLRQADAITAGRRTAQFLYWVHEKLATKKKTYLPDVLTERFIQTIRYDFANLADYVTYLETVREFMPSTLVNHINDIVRGAKWFVLFKAGRTLEPKDLEGITYIGANLNKNLKKALKADRGEVTMATEVYLRRQPAGGLAELQQAFPAQLEKLKTLLSAVPLIIGKNDYLWFTGMLYTSVYVFSPQGNP